MGQYNDCMATALIDQGYGPAAIQDMLYDYLLANGGLAGSLNDLWHQVWDTAGVSAGAFDDRAYDWLGSLGFTGALSDRWLAFWCSGGVITVETNLLLNNKLCDNDSSGAPDNWSKAIVPNVAGVTESDVVLYRRQSSGSLWLLAAVDGLVYIAQAVNLTAGEYVASFRIDWRQFPIQNDFKVGFVTGTGVTINQDFPTLVSLGAPPVWAHCQFTLSGTADVTMGIQAISPLPGVGEAIVVLRPQIIPGTSYVPATITGPDCIGPAIELLLDANREPLKDSLGEYLYVPI